jgi:hypothetical protein
VLVGQSLRGRPALKTAFNAGRLAVGITTALLDERRVFQPFYKGARRAAAASGCHSSPASRARTPARQGSRTVAARVRPSGCGSRDEKAFIRPDPS